MSSQAWLILLSIAIVLNVVTSANETEPAGFRVLRIIATAICGIAFGLHLTKLLGGV